MSMVKEIQLDEIRENPVALRAVNRESEAYIGLRDSIASVGILNPVNVRERTESVNGVDVVYYELLDGLHRFSALRDIGIEMVPIHVLSLSDAEALEAQIMANVHKIETRPVEYTKQLFRILGANPLLTLAELAAKVAKSPTWISQRLSLLKLDPAVQKLVDEGEISVTNAVQLAKLSPEEQIDHIDQAISMTAEEFVPLVLGRVKEVRDAVRQGRKSADAVFVANPKIRKMAVLSEEVNTGAVGPELCSLCNADSAADGFKLGVEWALQTDPVSVEVRTSMDTDRKTAQKEAKARRAAEREIKKADAAKTKAEAAAKAAGL